MEQFHFKIPLIIYPFIILVSLEESDEILTNTLIELGHSKDEITDIMNMSDITTGRCNILCSNIIVIRLLYQPKLVEMIGVITHEATHATTFIFDRIGSKLEIGSSDEHFAYIQELNI